MILRNKAALRINYDYVRDVFSTEQECLDFMRSLLLEFSDASECLKKAIQGKDLLLYRKTLHYVGGHLEMLGMYEFKNQLEEIKSLLADESTEALHASAYVLIADTFAAIERQVYQDWQLS